jgi:hypothetical protein
LKYDAKYQRSISFKCGLHNVQRVPPPLHMVAEEP